MTQPNYVRTFVVRDRQGNLVRREFSGKDREDALAKTFEWEAQEAKLAEHSQTCGSR